jgi:hypothetical protein
MAAAAIHVAHVVPASKRVAEDGTSQREYKAHHKAKDVNIKLHTVPAWFGLNGYQPNPVSQQEHSRKLPGRHGLSPTRAVQNIIYNPASCL